MDISVGEAHNRLSHLLREVERGKTVRITRRGKPIGVLIESGEYERLRQVQAYLEMLSISDSLRDSGINAREIYQTSRDELEQRP